MARFPKPPEGSWTQHYPELGTGPVSYEDSISPHIYELEREAIFKRAWLNVGRVESIPRKGSYFTKELKVANTSIIVVRNGRGEVNAFHNICRHRGNKLVWNDMPLEETSGVCRQFTCKYHAWRYDLDGNLTFVQQEERVLRPRQEPLRAGVGALRRLGRVYFRQLRQGAASSRLREFLGPMITDLEGYPFGQADLAVVLPVGGEGELEALHGRVPGVLSRTGVAREPVADGLFEGRRGGWFRGAALPHRRPAPAGQYLGCARLGDGARDAQADRGHLPERTVRALGQARSRGDARWAESREM